MYHVKIVSRFLVLALLLSGATASAAPARPVPDAGSRSAAVHVWSWLEAIVLALLPAPQAAHSLAAAPEGLDAGACIDPMGGSSAQGGASAALAASDRGVCIDPMGGSSTASATCLKLDQGACIDPIGGQ